MKVWVMQGVYEGDLFSSVHLTEKGAALAAIADVFDFLGVECAETARSAMDRCYAYPETDGEQAEPFEWDLDKMRKMKRDELWPIFRQWAELTWDNSQGYNIEVTHGGLQP